MRAPTKLLHGVFLMGKQRPKALQQSEPSPESGV